MNSGIPAQHQRAVARFLPRAAEPAQKGVYGIGQAPFPTVQAEEVKLTYVPEMQTSTATSATVEQQAAAKAANVLVPTAGTSPSIGQKILWGVGAFLAFRWLLGKKPGLAG